MNQEDQIRTILLSQTDLDNIELGYVSSQELYALEHSTFQPKQAKLCYFLLTKISTTPLM